MRVRLPAALLAVLVVVAAAGCTPKVPVQSVELSMAVGERITAMQASHESFVSETFDLSRARIEDFLQQRWVPAFLARFTRDAELMERLERPHPFDETERERLREELQDRGIADVDAAVAAVESALGDEERGALVLEFAEAAVTEIERRRRELLAPLDAREAEALHELRANYAELAAMNASVTQYLQSIHEVSEMREDVLRRLRLQRSRDAALERVADVNRALEQAIEGAGEAEEILDRIRDVLDRDDSDTPGEED